MDRNIYTVYSRIEKNFLWRNPIRGTLVVVTLPGSFILKLD